MKDGRIRGSSNIGCLLAALLLGGLIYGVVFYLPIHAPDVATNLAKWMLALLATAILCITLIAVAAIGVGRLAVKQGLHAKRDDEPQPGESRPSGAGRILGDLFAAGASLGGRGVKGSGVCVTERRDLPPFRKIVLSGKFNAAVCCQQEQKVEISGDDNIVPSLQTDVKDGTLMVSLRNATCPASALRLAVACADISSLRSSGASDVTITRVDNEALEISISGAGDVKASGRTQRLVVGISGAGDVDARDLQAGTARVQISGAGDVELSVSDELDATVTGAGDIVYHGNPKVVNRRILGAGMIEKKE